MDRLEEPLDEVVVVELKNKLTRSQELSRVVATYYSIITNCLMNRIDPGDYIADATYRINADWPQSKLNELLSWNWKPYDRDGIERGRRNKAVKLAQLA